MEIEKYTPLARSIDINVPSNRFILIFSIFSFLLYSFVSLFRDASYSLSVGISISISVFVAWVLTRELDPDKPTTANIAAIFTSVFSILLFPGVELNATIAFLAIVIMRMIVRTVGKKFGIIDLALVVGLTFYIAHTNFWPVLLASTFALILEALLPKRNIIAIVFALITAVGIGYYSTQIGFDHEFNLVDSLVPVWGLILFVITSILIFHDINSVTDITNEKLSKVRMFAGRMAFAILFLIFIVHTDPQQVYMHMSLWISLWVFSFASMYSKLKHIFSKLN